MKKRFNIIVITEDLVDYVFTVAKTAPKQLRSDIIPLFRQYSTHILESIIRANLCELDDKQRFYYQQEAKVNIDLLNSLSQICQVHNYITFHQLDVLGEKTFKLFESIDAWIESDKSRLASRKGNK